MQKHMKTDRGYMHQLDALRFLAAFGVLNFHWCYYFWDSYSWSLGEYGVQLFFVLSGFLITGQLLKAKEINTNKVYIIKTFFIRRALRLFPIYYLFLLFLIRMDDGYVKNNLGYFLTYTSNFFFYSQGGFVDRWSNHTWTLAVEEQFYLVFPWLLLFMKRTYEPLLGILFILAGIGVRAYGLWQGIDNIKLVTPANFEALGTGILLGNMFFRNTLFLSSRKKYLSSLLLFFFCLTFYLHYFQTGWLVSIPFRTSFLIFSALFVYEAAIGFKGLWGKIFKNKILRYLGRISYGIYLYHFISPFIVTKIFEKASLHTPSNMYLWYGINLLFLFLICMLSWHFIETPIQQLKKFFNYAKPAKCLISSSNTLQTSIKTSERSQSKDLIT